MKKSLLVIVLAVSILVVVTFSLYGCKTEEATTVEEEATTVEEEAASVEEEAVSVEEVSGKLVVWSYLNEGEPLQEWHAQVEERFREEYPDVELNIMYQGREIMTILRAKLQDPDAPDFPDVVSDMSSFLKPLANEGLFYDLSEDLDTGAFDQDKTWRDTFIQTLMDDLELDGKSYRIPYTLYIHAVHYDKALFNKLGISVPETWDDFVEVCNTLIENDIAPVSLDGALDYYTIWYFIRFAERLAGPDALTEAANGEISFKDNQGFLEAAEYVAKFAENKWFQEGYMGSAWPASQALFAQGKTGMIFVGTWFPAEVLELTPPDMEIGIFSVPEVENSVSPRHEEVWGNALAVMNNSSSKDLAIRYLKILTSMEMDPLKAEKFTSSPLIGGTPVPQLSEMESIVGNATSISSSYNDLLGLGDYFINVLGYNCSRLISGEYSPEEFIDELDKGTMDYYQ